VLAASIISAAQDFITAILPTFLYWNLRIPLKQKMALFGIFAIGYGVVALGLLRAYYSWRTFYNTWDVTWSTWDILITSMLELHIGCLCANAPALKVFFKHFFQEKLSSLSKSRSPTASKERQDSGHGSSAHVKSTGLWSKLASKLSSSSGSYNSKGYHDSHNGVSVDNQGGVHVHKEVQISRSPTSMIAESPGNRHMSSITADIICDRDYDDIELGRYTTGHNSHASSMRSTLLVDESDLGKLPPLPQSPTSPMSPTSSDFAMQHVPQSMIGQAISSFPSAAAKHQSIPARSLTPFPTRESSNSRQTRSTWHSAV